jgi:hypothetical protein
MNQLNALSNRVEYYGLRYELFRGRLGEGEYKASEQNLADYIKAHENSKQHLNKVITMIAEIQRE